MRASGAALLIAVGLLILWVVLTGRLGRVLEIWSTVKDMPPESGGAARPTSDTTRRAWLPFPGADDFLARTTRGAIV
jgi:hypothetical protein